MTGLRLILFNLLTAISALLCAATLAMWGRSYFVGDVWIRQTPATVRDSIDSSHGSVAWGRNRLPPGVFGPGISSRHTTVPPTALGMDRRFAGFGWEKYVSPTLTYVGVLIPYWALFALTAAVTLICRRISRIERHVVGHCPSCGYDLRATPEDQSRYPLNYACRFGAD